MGRPSFRLTLFCLGLAFLTGQFAFSAPPGVCQKTLDALNPILMGSDAARPLDIPPGEMGKDEQELRRIFLNLKPAEFDAVWKNVSKSDLKDLAEKVKSGQLKATPAQARRLQALASFVEGDKNNVLWSNDSSPFNGVETHYPAFRGPASSGNLGGVIGGVDTSSLTSLEKEIVAAGLKASYSRIGAGSHVKRFISPPYSRVRDILAFNDAIRSQLEHVDQAKGTLLSVLDEASHLKLDDNEKKILADGLELLQDQRKGAKHDLEAAYGQDITTGGVIVNPDIDIYRIADRIRKGNFHVHGDDAPFIKSAEKAMDKLDEAMDRNRARLGLPKRQLADYPDTELRIRHRQSERETQEARTKESEFYDMRGPDSITVNYHYETTETYPEPETYTDGQGNVRTRTVLKTRVVTRYGSTSEHPSYKEIILQRLSRYSPGHSFSNGTIDSVSGKQAILDASAAVAKREGGLENQFRQAQTSLENAVAHHLETLNRAQADPGALKAAKAQVSEARSALSKLVAEAEEYAKWSRDKVRAQWASDDIIAFDGRTEALVAASKALSRRYAIYDEQLGRKQYQLKIDPATPDYSHELSILRGRQIRNYLAKAGMGALVLAIAACEAADHMAATDNDRHQGCLIKAWNKLRGSSDDSSDSEDSYSSAL